MYQIVIVSSWTRVDYATFIVKDNKQIQGNPYAFEKWENRGVLFVDGKRYRFNDINFNMRTNTIESQIVKDSIYIFDLSNVDYAYINNRKFKSYYFPKKRKNEIFEMLYDGEGFKFLIDYEVGIKRPVVDPAMVRKPVARYFTTERFYVKRLNNIEEISLKKKHIMHLFKGKSNQMSNYIKINKLSFKRKENLKKMFEYYSKLK